MRNVPNEFKYGDVVIVKLIEARNLKKTDFIFSRRSSDPYVIYVIFVLGTSNATSAIKKKNVNPVWNEKFWVYD